MLIATFHLELEAVALEEAFASVPNMTVDVERIVAHGIEGTMPCLWIEADKFEAVDIALNTDPTVDRIIYSEQFDNMKYYHIEWSEDIYRRFDVFVDHEGSVLTATASKKGWVLKIRFVTRDQFDQFREVLRDRGYDFELIDLYDARTPRHSAVAVTPRQREALVTAVKSGYYKIPREISARELGKSLGMSHQSVSELLRRGTENLVTSTLMISTSDE